MIPCLILIQRRSSHAQRTSHPIRSLESKRMPGGRSAIPLNRENSLQAALGNNLRRIVLNVLFAMQRRHAVCEVFIRTRYGEDKAFQEFSGAFSALGDGGSGLFGRPDPTCERTGALQQSRSIVCSRPIDRKEGKSSTVHLETTIIPLCGPKMLPGVPGPEPRRPEPTELLPDCSQPPRRLHPQDPRCDLRRRSQG